MDKLDSYLPDNLKNIDKVIAGKAPHSDIDRSSMKDSINDDKSKAGAETSKILSSDGQEPNKNGEKSMADSINKEDIRKEVKAMLEEKDAQASVEKKIEVLSDEKAELAQKLEEVTAAKDTLSSELEQVKADLSSKTQECEALATEKEESVAKANEFKTKLDEIEAEKALAERTRKLEEKGLLLSEGTKREAQLEKVKAMSEDVFTGYVEELAEIKELVSASTKDDSSQDGQQTNKTDGDDGDGDGKQKAQASADSIVPASIPDGQKFSQTVAAASAQVSLDEDQVSMYANM